MKLHLPKALLVATMLGTGAVYAATVDASEYTTINDGVTYLNVGTTSDTYKWTGDLTIGDSSEEQGDADKLGAFDSSWEWITPNGNDTVQTSEVVVDGNLKIQGTGQVILGGQKGSTHRGITAKEVTVQGEGNMVHLDAGRARFDKITVISGKAEINNTPGCTGGNTSSSYTGYRVDAKQAHIKNAIDVQGGELQFGYHNAQKTTTEQMHSMTHFGSGKAGIEIMQSGGDMNVWADASADAGMVIEQKDNAGKMVFRDNLLLTNDGTMTVNQSGDSAKLVFGRISNYTKTSTFLGQTIVTTTKSQVDINQSGEGLIHLAYGTQFSAASTVNLTQTGAGEIKLGGGHDTAITGSLQGNFNLSGYKTNNTTYTIDQSTSSGTITLADDVSINASSLKLSTGALLDIDGNLVLNSGGVLEINASSADDAAVSLGSNGSLSLTDTATELKLTLSDVVASNMQTALSTADAGTFTYTIDLISADAATQLEALSEKLNWQYEGPSELALALEEAKNQVTLESSGLQVSQAADGTHMLQAYVSWNVQGNIPEPTTATLSLLALTALAARRRRK